MTIKVLKYYPQPYGDYQLGFCRVDLDGGYRCFLKVARSKNDNIFCSFVAVKIDEQWMSSFYPVDRDDETDLLEECRKQVKVLMGDVPQEETTSVPLVPPVAQPVEEEALPF